MRVIHTIASLRLETGGPARSVPGLAAALARCGAEVHLWSADDEGAPMSPDGAEIHRGDLGDVLQKIGRVDLVHDHGLWLPSNHRTAGICRLRDLPRMVSPRGMLEPWALNHRRWKKRVAWWLYQRSDLRGAAALHATAPSEAEQFRRLGLTRPIHVIPNGVELLPEREDYEGNTGSRVVLFLSRIHPKKGLPMWVEAWAKVRPPGWKMLVAGPNEAGHREEVEKMVREAGLEKDWEFIGPLEGTEKEAAFRGAGLFVLPTFSENFGIAVAEALVHGVPVITTTGAPWEGLMTHRCGWWVSPQADDLAGALLEAVSLSDEERRQRGDRGQQWMSAEFGWEAIASRTLQAYEEILRSA